MPLRFKDEAEMRQHLGSRAPKLDEPAKPKGKRRGDPNKLELAFRHEWLAQREQIVTINSITYEAITLRFYDGSADERPAAWTCDWAWWELRDAGFVLCLAEVKGSRNMKNARASIRGVKACATRFPRIWFCIAERMDGGWRVNEL